MLALTDHDTTEGIQEAQQAASALDDAPRIIAGVEISLTWDNTVIHMLGLNIDPEQTDLKQGLIRLGKQRQERAEQIAEKLEAAGVENAYEGTKALSKGQALSRTHFAHYLVQQGFSKDVRKVFKHYLVRGKPGMSQANGQGWKKQLVGSKRLAAWRQLRILHGIK
jgi:predicted metal-dependent phosphoesterase TrpH